MTYKSHRLFAGAVALTIMASGEVPAAEVSGQQLLAMCTSHMRGDGKTLEAAECLGFVAGVSQTFDCTEDNHGFTWNSGANVSPSQLVADVIKFMEDHPAAQDYEGHRIVGAALSAAFPCQPKTAQAEPKSK